MSKHKNLKEIRMKRKLLVLALTSLFALCSFFGGRYIARKINWTHELKFKVMVNSRPHWMKEQIGEDFSSIQAADLAPSKIHAVFEAQAKTGNRHMLALYQIRDNQLKTTYPGKLKDHPRVPVMEKAFEEVMEVTKLPDVDCLVSLADSADHAGIPVPFLAFAKDASLKELVILMPDFEALEGHSAILKEVQKGSSTYPWHEKLAKAFWRGAMTGHSLFTTENFLNPPRSRLVTLAIQNPDFLDARYSCVTQAHEPEKIRASYENYFGEPIQVRDHLFYKYQILVDGNSCAYSRAVWQLFSGCTIFKQSSENIQWYYKGLSPYVHYVPVAHDFNDLIEKMNWAKENDAMAKQIGLNAQAFAKKYLKKSDIRFYLVTLLKEYAKIQSLGSTNIRS